MVYHNIDNTVIISEPRWNGRAAGMNDNNIIIKWNCVAGTWKSQKKDVFVAVPWKRKWTDDVIDYRTRWETGGEGHTQPPPARCRQANGKISAMFSGRQAFETRRNAALFATLTVTIAGRKPGEPLAKSFEMRILSDFVSERVPHAFCRCRD